jgi:phage repressor protein C with HTH and peptisase S24 domain
MDAVRKLILEKLQERGLTMKEASLRIGKSHSYLQQFLKRGIPTTLGEDERGALSQILGVDEQLLRGRSPALPKKEYAKQGGSVAETQPDTKTSDIGHSRVDAAHNLASMMFGDRDLPVFGTASGPGGNLIVSDLAVDYVVRPAPLLRVRDGYGMIVTGNSMFPKIKNGDTVLVNPHLPPQTGDYCVLRHREPETGVESVLVKELKRSTDENWHVHRDNPPKAMTLKRSEWQCHVIVGTYFRR